MENAEFAAMSEDELERAAFHEVSMTVLRKLCNPFACWVEQSSPITQKEVKDCIIAGKAQLCTTPTWSEMAFGKVSITPEENRQRHISKIAYFVINDIQEPIDIEVGCQNLGCMPPSHIVEDGNHRLAAAIIKGDTTVRARIGGGVEDAKQMGLWNPNPAFQELERRWEKKYRKAPGP